MFRELLEKKKYRKIYKLIHDRKFATYNIENIDNKRYEHETYEKNRYRFQCVSGAEKLLRRHQQELVLKRYRHYDVVSLLTPFGRIHTQVIIQTRSLEDDL